MNEQKLREALQDMIDMMDSGDESGAGSPWYLKAKAALATTEPEPFDEREAFEKWAAPNRFDVGHKGEDGSYLGRATSIAWAVWQARAALQSSADVRDGGLKWFTVAKHGLPDKGEEVIGGLWYTDPWLKPEFATTFMWGQCRVVEGDRREFKGGKRWQTFGPSHNQITHWARINKPDAAIRARSEGGV